VGLRDVINSPFVNYPILAIPAILAISSPEASGCQLFQFTTFCSPCH